MTSFFYSPKPLSRKITELFQALAKLQTELKPLMDGCHENRSNWQKLSERRNKGSVDEQDRETHDKDNNAPDQQQQATTQSGVAIRKLSPVGGSSVAIRKTSPSSGGVATTAIRKTSPSNGQ